MRIITGIFLHFSIWVHSFRNCLPFIRGMFRSRKIRSGFTSSEHNFFIASCPFIAVTQRTEGATCSSTLRKISWSSMSSSIKKQVNCFFTLSGLILQLLKGNRFATPNAYLSFPSTASLTGENYLSSFLIERDFFYSDSTGFFAGSAFFKKGFSQ